MEKKNSLKTKKFLTYAGVVALILAAIIISLLFYRQKIEITRDVFKNITSDWQTFKSNKYGFSFKYPKDRTVKEIIDGYDGSTIFFIDKNNDKGDDHIELKVSESRSINRLDPIYAIQISIPFDKKNYLIFSTSTNNDQKEIFYNIPVTLEFGK